MIYYPDKPPHTVPQTTTLINTVSSNQVLSQGTAPSTSIHHQVSLVVLVPLATTILLCNVVVLAFLVANRKLHKPSYFFIGCMSFADFTVGCVAVWTIEWAGDRSFVPCLVRMGLLTSVVVASLFCMGCIAVDRYIAITTPFAYNRKVTKVRAALAMAIVWLASFCIGFAPLMGWDVEHSTVYCSFCYIDTIEYEAFLFVVGFGAPMCTTIFIYILLFKNARVHIQRMEVVEKLALGCKAHVPARHRCFWRSRRWRSSQTLVVMISCFLVTWCPFVVTSVIQMICGDDTCDLKDIISTYLLLLGFCNSFLNPVIYAASNKEFKAVVWAKLTAVRKKMSCQT